MSMPLYGSTLNGSGFKSQGRTFDEFSVNLPPSSEDSHKEKGVTSENSVGVPIPDPKERLLGLTPTQQKIVRAVRKLGRSDARGVSQILGISRFAGLGHLNTLADDKGVLGSSRFLESRGGAKKTIHFWLADDIPAELVDAVLGNSDIDPEAILETHKRRSKTKSAVEPQEADLSPMATFAAMSPTTKQIALAIGEAGKEGISPTDLSRVTGQRPKRIYERLPLVEDKGFAEKRSVPGFKNRSVYIPTPVLLEIVEQLASGQNQNADPAFISDKDSEGISTMPPKQQSSSNSSQAVSDKLTEESNLPAENIDEVWKALIAVAEKVKTLERRCARIEASLQGKNRVRAAEILAILDDEP